MYPRHTKFLNDSKQSVATVHKHSIQITIYALYIVTSFNYSYIYNISKCFLFYILFVASLHYVMLLLMYNNSWKFYSDDTVQFDCFLFLVLESYDSMYVLCMYYHYTYICVCVCVRENWKLSNHIISLQNYDILSFVCMKLRRDLLTRFINRLL